MRSRYAAYAKGLVDYIIATTDPSGPIFRADTTTWRTELEQFCAGTRFEGLTILAESDWEGSEATVTFRVVLRQRGEDASFEECSLFRRRSDRWFYVGPMTT